MMHANDIANYLAEHPDFFDQHPEVLSGMQLPHPHNGQAISLVERQSMMLRERIKSLEARVAEMVRHAQDNDAIGRKLTQWMRSLLLVREPSLLPETLTDELKRIYEVPFVALRLWEVAPAYVTLPSANAVDDDTISFVDSMRLPFCGSNVGFEPAAWLGDGGTVQSLAMLPLRVGADPRTFGLLVLGSPDKDRFHPAMGTAFLERIAELASAALARLRS